MFGIVYLAAVIAVAYGGSEVLFLHSPKSIVFNGEVQLDQSLLREVVSVSLGFTTNEGRDWNGVKVLDPFHYAEAAVTVVVDGCESLAGLKGHRFPLFVDEDEDATWLMLRHRVRERFPGVNTTLMRVELADGIIGVEHYTPVLGDIETLPHLAHNALDGNSTVDKEILSELSLLRAIVKRVEAGAVKHDGAPDIYWFVLPGLRSVINYHGIDSAEAQEAKELLSEVIVQLKKAFVNAYNGNVLVSLVTSNDNHVRQTRSLREDEKATDNDKGNLNLSKDYGPNYPVIFNILLWFMVAFTFTILAVSVGIASMDPGRDSIIYRMTSNRMKKDN